MKKNSLRKKLCVMMLTLSMASTSVLGMTSMVFAAEQVQTVHHMELKSSEKSLLNESIIYYLNPKDKVSAIDKVIVDGKEAKEYRRNDSVEEKPCFVRDNDSGSIKIHGLKDGNKVEFVSSEGVLSFKAVNLSSFYSNNYADVEYKADKSLGETDTGSDKVNSAENNTSDSRESSSSGNNKKINSGKVNKTYYSTKIYLEPETVLKEIDGIRVNKKPLKNDRNYSWAEGHFYVRTEEKYIEIGKLEANDIIGFYKGDELLGTFKYDESTGTLVEEQPVTVHPTRAALRGTFNSAMVGQKKYDGISGATMSVTENKDSNAEVFATCEEGDEHWQLLHKSGLKSRNSKVKVNLDPESGMKGNFNEYTSAITLSGIPQKAGRYKISVTFTDQEGKDVTTNQLDFNVYETGKDKLIDLIDPAKGCGFRKMQDGKYIWDMEPWNIETFSDNNEVVVPEEIKAIYGSHTRGVYGELGIVNDRESGKTPVIQKLIVGKDTNLTLVNMRVKNSVEIIVKDGGVLNLRDSSVNGKIILENGGRLQSNFDTQKKSPISGSSVNGEIVIKDGGIIENSTIYSNVNFAAEGGKARRVEAPIIRVTGKGYIRGNVAVKGDEAATGKQADGITLLGGQHGVSIEKDGELIIEDNSILTVSGGGNMQTTGRGGNAVILDGGKVSGNGALIAVAGTSASENGVEAVAGKGELSVKTAILRGGNTNGSKSTGGRAKSDAVKTDSKTILDAVDGRQITVMSDYDQPLYWNGASTIPDFVKEHEAIKKAAEAAPVDPGTEEPKPAEPGPAEPGPAEPGPAEPGPAEPEQAEPEQAEYKVVTGGNSIWSKGSKDTLKIVIKRTADDNKTFDNFEGIEIDGKPLDRQAYTAKAGSVIIDIKPEYLDSLEPGRHNLKANFKDGSAVASMEVVAASNTNNENNITAESNGSVVNNADVTENNIKEQDIEKPSKKTEEKSKAENVKTGDNIDIAIWIVLMIVATCGMFAVYKRKHL